MSHPRQRQDAVPGALFQAAPEAPPHVDHDHDESARSAPPPPPQSRRPDVAPRERVHEVLGRDGAEIRILGRLLAHASSEREEHSHPIVDPFSTSPGIDTTPMFASRQERCSACRWFEVNIYTVTADVVADPDECTCGAGASAESNDDHSPLCGTELPSGRYLVATAGRTRVPGEVNFRRAAFTDSPFEVVELLRVESARDRHVRVERGLPDSDAVRTLPTISTRALAQAAGFDSDLRAAYLAHVASTSSATGAADIHDSGPGRRVA